MEQSRRRRLMLAGAVAMMAGFAIAAGVLFFGPKGTTQLEESLDDTASGPVVALKEGLWKGADDFHHASGSLRLLHDDRGYFLFFEDFDARAGPDVYLYLSTTPDGDWEGGDRLKVLMAGGAEDGQATLRGDFRVDLPGDFDPGVYNSAILWCDDFATLFGTAALA